MFWITGRRVSTRPNGGAQIVKYRVLGKTGFEVSELSLGGGIFTSCDEKSIEKTSQIVHRALELGVNYIDTAPAYGESEKVLGHALAGMSDQIIISTKFGGRPVPFDPQNKDDLRRSFEESLKLLKRDAIDILFIHEPDRPGQYNWFPDWDNFHGPVCDLMNELKAEGLVRFTGLAGTTAYTMARIVMTGEYDVVLTAFNYSLLWQEALVSIVPEAKKRNMGIVIGSPLQHGALAQCYTEEIENGAGWLSPPRREQFKKLYALVKDVDIPIAELGLRYMLSNKDLSAILIGVKSVEELEQNVSTVEAGPLPEEIVRRIDEMAQMVPFRPYEEPYKLPFNTNYKGPGHIGKLQFV
jgi:aryl-alcohol dehydrogenase-like predicted oxidoreductase